MLNAIRSFFRRRLPASHDPPAPAVSPARKLVAEFGSEFFTWFQLEPDGDPEPEGVGLVHRFRPAGDAFHALVALDVAVDSGGGMKSTRLALDRSFVNGPQDAFARDIARSFLDWMLDDAARARVAPLIENIGNLAAASGPVITAQTQAQPPRDKTGAYAVFTGDRDATTVVLGRTILTLTNADGWLSINVDARV